MGRIIRMFSFFASNVNGSFLWQSVREEESFFICHLQLIMINREERNFILKILFQEKREEI